MKLRFKRVKSTTKDETGKGNLFHGLKWISTLKIRERMKEKTNWKKKIDQNYIQSN